MIIGINAIGLYPGKNGGAEQYIRNIVKKLCEYNDISTIIFLNDYAINTFTEYTGLTVARVDLSFNHDAQLLNLIELYRVDVYFCPLFHLIPAKCPVPNLTAIFDIQQEFYPENFDKRVLRDRKAFTRNTVTATDRILTISDYSKKTLIEKLNVPSEKIGVTYLDADDSFNLPIDNQKMELIRDELPKEYILFPANMWPHKNHVALLNGYAIAKQKYRIPLKLVFTGSEERETKEIEKTIDRLQIRDDVKYLGYVKQDDMRYIYKCANMLAFPSKFEGFGIPLVEAMAVGTPIICSKSSCLPEIAKDAAVYFDEDNYQEVAEAIYEVYSNDQMRSDLIQKGIARRKDFSWDKCADETVENIRSLYVPRKQMQPVCGSHPKVTVITPSYNQGEFIKGTIESVLNQTYDNIEYIVMDGGSTDNTVEILKSYGNRLRFVSEKDNGQADAVNKGIRSSTGQIIGWLNSDDTYYPNAIKNAVKAFLEHPEVDMVYGEGMYIDKNSHELNRYPTRVFTHEELANECYICQPTAFFTRRIIEQVGELRSDLQLCMDYELWMRISKHGHMLYLPEKMATSRMYEENKTLSRRKEVYEECCNEIRKHYGYVPTGWISGYASFMATRHTYLKYRDFFMALFLRYNAGNPMYCQNTLSRYYHIKKSRTKGTSTENFNGRWADNWISSKAIFDVSCAKENNRLIIKGDNILSEDSPIKLTVTVGPLSKEFDVDSGIFVLSMDVSPVNNGTITVIIEADKTYIPTKMNPKDSRKLSVRINEIFTRNAEPLVTVVTPSLNQGRFIKATIDSVLMQDYPNIEYIVMDGGSTDGTKEILASYENRITVISEHDNGQSDAINKGFRIAKGEIIAWLNSDDTYEPSCITKIVKCFNEHAEAGMVYGNGNIIDETGSVVRIFEYSNPFDLWKLINMWDYIMQPTVFFRRKVLEKVGYLDENLQWCMDWDLWIRISLKEDVVYIPEILASSREYDCTKTNTGGERRLAEIYRIMNKYSGDKNPYGYATYEYAEILAKGGHGIDSSDIRKKMYSIIDKCPTPDVNGYCANETNFTIKEHQNCKAIEIEVLKGKEETIRIYINNKKYKTIHTVGSVNVVELPNDFNVIRKIKVLIDDDELSQISKREDSWVKMRLK